MSKTRSHFITRFSDFVSRRFRGHKSATKPPNTFVLSKRGKIKALMEVVQRYDVRANASPHALFMPKHSEKPGPVKYWIQRDLGQPKGKLEAIHSWFGFVIYCTPQDHPADPVYQTYREPNAWWGRLTSDPLTLMPYYPFVQLCKPALFLAQVGWDEIDEWADLNTLYLRTHIDELDQRPPNQPADLDWAVEKCNWLWSKALPNEPLPKIKVYTTRADDERKKSGAVAQSHTRDAEHAVDVMAFWAWGAGSREAAAAGEEAFQALQACGPGWHTWSEIEEKLEGKATEAHENGLSRYWRLGKIDMGTLEEDMPPGVVALTGLYKVISPVETAD